MAEAKCKITIFLSNPDGVVEREIMTVWENEETKKNAHKQILMSIFREGGLWREISEDEHDFIPLTRVKNAVVKFEPIAVTLADPSLLGETIATARAVDGLKNGPRLVHET